MPFYPQARSSSFSPPAIKTSAASRWTTWSKVRTVLTTQWSLEFTLSLTALSPKLSSVTSLLASTFNRLLPSRTCLDGLSCKSSITLRPIRMKTMRTLGTRSVFVWLFSVIKTPKIWSLSLPTPNLVGLFHFSALRTRVFSFTQRAFCSTDQKSKLTFSSSKDSFQSCAWSRISSFLPSPCSLFWTFLQIIHLPSSSLKMVLRRLLNTRRILSCKLEDVRALTLTLTLRIGSLFFIIDAGMTKNQSPGQCNHKFT